MAILMHNAATRHKARKIGFAAIVLIASVGAVAAQGRQPPRPDQYYGLYPNQDQDHGLALSRWDRARFDRSGTRGREGLGAAPLRPEGPGNVAD
ncbi:hypothetical protein RZS28_03525 [Methylocapsa polymorpha]|uniref:Uncharacterized protein n=1 Tax=Methylocapsa polymorpha TaxID=3080828 RepID=A0ABZ0HUB1_9HYPH|nr:hypothetical protein RZS28_03525 [Methylocapsa sp. RX1]